MYFMYMSALSSCTPKEIRSHYRWLGAPVWLLGLNSGPLEEQLMAIIHWAISPIPPFLILLRPWNCTVITQGTSCANVQTMVISKTVCESLSEMWKAHLCLVRKEQLRSFVTLETDLSARTFLFQNDLLFLKVTSQLHHLSIKCAIHVLHVNKFNPNCLHRRPADEVGECTSCPDGPESGHLG